MGASFPGHVGASFPGHMEATFPGHVGASFPGLLPHGLGIRLHLSVVSVLPQQLRRSATLGPETDLVQLCDELPDVGVHPEWEEEDAGELAQ